MRITRDGMNWRKSYTESRGLPIPASYHSPCHSVSAAPCFCYGSRKREALMVVSRSLLLAVFAAALALSPLAARAEYPDRPITAIVPFAPGGPADIIGRILSTFMPQQLGQGVVIENRGGAAGNIGMGQAARAKPDGYTLLMTSTAIAVNTALFNNLPYDPVKDFAPISELVNAPNVLVVRSDSGIMTVADLVARVKANPNTFSYGSPGAGTKSHLTGEQLKLRAGIAWCTCRSAAPARPRKRCWPDRSRLRRWRSPPPKGWSSREICARSP